MERCTDARAKGVAMGLRAARSCASTSAGATVSDVCPSMTLLQSSPSTALQHHVAAPCQYKDLRLGS